MDDNLSDLVRDSKLRTRYEKPHTIHLFDDPDAPPFSARRREQWKKDRTIGHGGQGRVVLQTCTGGSRGYTQRAVKMIPLQEGGRRRYLRELEAILKFSHDKYAKYFAKTLGWYTSQSRLYIAMEYFPAGDLHSYALKYAPLPENECCEIASQILRGLAAMHQESFAHRDVKLHNILIHQSPRSVPPAPWWVKLADFGISKRLEAGTSGSTRRNGTLLYMAPELLISELSDGSRFDYPAVDLWALGVTTFFILTKSLPFQDLSSVIKYASDANRSFPETAFLNCKVSMDGQAFVRALMRRKPTERLNSWAAMRHAWNHPWRPETQTPPPHSGQIQRSGQSFKVAHHVRSSQFSSMSCSFDEGTDGSSGLDDVSSQLYSKSWSHEDTEKTNSAFEILRSRWNEDGDDWLLLAALSDDAAIRDYLLLMKGGFGAAKRAALSQAIFSDMEGFINFLIETSDNLDSRTRCGNTPLHLAAKAGNLSVVPLLIKAGVNIEAKNSDGETALSEASKAGIEVMVEMLVEEGANIEAKNKKGETPLVHAVVNGHEGTTERLVSMGADLQSRDIEGNMVFLRASEEGKMAMVRGLAKKH
ncbi:Protein kinase domain-containing protein [Fusarium keratoplasticum]|uniref:Protein kinase domain-containing protein n=1 Tax=Fusarium keratoplasticum TaxID=1328300 RepID=A0ACC0QFB8_9HYPO|nr:Protein kinase domain-containing protein [Fusarium keratoplasticum]KAI8650992.1 Protein kinase domain-containing protein [Fusarium keratoplasticum]